MIIDANDSYCEEFGKGNKLKAMWWDGYLEALHRVMDYYENDFYFLARRTTQSY